jgi:arsenate reductase
MAEAFLNDHCPDDFAAESAGLEPGSLNPLAIEVMREVGIDISDKTTKSSFDLFKAGRRYSYVVTVCDETSAERCPIFRGGARHLHWSFPDPAALEGSWEERLARTRAIRDEIRGTVEAFCAETCGPELLTNRAAQAVES